MNIWTNRKWKPMLLKEINEPFNNKNFIYEIKFDGIRACIFVNKDKIQIISRNNIDMTHLYPELDSIRKLVNVDTIIDGEIVMMDKNKPSFSKLMERNHLKNKDRIIKESINNPVSFVAFDIIYKEKDITNLALFERKKILNKIKDNDVFVKSKVFKDGIKLFKKIKELSLEGIVAKEKNSTYEINTRTFNWIKIKNIKVSTFIIGGYELKKNDYMSLLLGEYRNNKLYYVGNVTLTKNLNIYEKVLKCKMLNRSPFIDYNINEVIYIKPSVKCEVKYLERTKTNHLRQPIIKRINNEIK